MGHNSVGTKLKFGKSVPVMKIIIILFHMRITMSHRNSYASWSRTGTLAGLLVCTENPNKFYLLLAHILLSVRWDLLIYGHFGSAERWIQKGG